MLNILGIFLFCILFLFVVFLVGKFVDSTMTEEEKNDQTLVEYPDDWGVWRTATKADYDFEQEVYQCLFVLFVIGYVILQLISFIISLIW